MVQTEPSVSNHADSPAPGGPHLRYLPGLDGLRGIAVVAVLCFHGGFSWAIGGYLGVSTFFTLSGFLITTLVLTEHLSTGKLDLRAFWVRRFRRLMPAALAALSLAVVFGLLAADVSQRRHLGGDVVASLADVANWRFIFSHQSYADLFSFPSPVLHFWSLAIEEQFYLLFPLLVFGLFALAVRHRVGRFAASGPRDRRFLGIGFAVLAIVSVSESLFLGFDQQRIYLGTDTRAAELLIGALLAVIVYRARTTDRFAEPSPLRTAIAGAGVLALATAVVLWITVDQSSAWLYHGGLAAYAVLSALIVLAATLPSGPVVALLRTRPLVHIGRISYGVYVYHWPIFLWMRQKTDLGPWPRFAIAVALTFAVAEVSHRWLEQPVRRGNTLVGVRPMRLAPLAIATIAVFAIVISNTAPKPAIDLVEAAAALDAAAAPPPETSAPGPTDPAAPPPPKRVAFFGDSTALMTGLGYAEWLKATDAGVVAMGESELGCSLLGGKTIRTGKRTEAAPNTCPNWPVVWKQTVDDSRPDLAVVEVGVWEVQDRQIGNDPTWRTPGDPIYDQALLDRMLQAVDVLSSDGATVVWLTSPLPNTSRMADKDLAAIAPDRLSEINDQIAKLPSLRPGKVRVVDLAGWIAQTPNDADRRPDGIHFSRESSYTVAEQFLGAAVLDRTG